MNSDRFNNIGDVYNRRYSNGYRETLYGYECARWSALHHFISKILKMNNAIKVLDYGSGSGLYVDLWRTVFPSADLYFCDISSIALDIIRKKYPEFKLNVALIESNRAPFDNDSFDVVLSIEVIEHVENLIDYLRDIRRLIKPGGMFVWTTPCANRFSVEHMLNALTKNIENTADGYRRWKWEDPAHIRRMKSNEMRAKLQEIGFEKFEFRFRAHFFSYVCTRLCKGPLTHFGEKLMLLDYLLFRRLPNGASMIGSASRLDKTTV